MEQIISFGNRRTTSETALPEDTLRTLRALAVQGRSWARGRQSLVLYRGEKPTPKARSSLP